MSVPALQSSNEFYLKAVSGGLKGTVFRLSSKEIFIGRDSSNHISIPDDVKISRRHARFILNKDAYHIQNLSANNFIKVNNEKVMQMVISEILNKCWR
jgi:pSer/pThr/pTyr-binding forkhead associated (FHA) protein